MRPRCPRAAAARRARQVSQCGVGQGHDHILAHLVPVIYLRDGTYSACGHAYRVQCGEHVGCLTIRDQRVDLLLQCLGTRHPIGVRGDVAAVRVEADDRREPAPQRLGADADHDVGVLAAEYAVRRDRRMPVTGHHRLDARRQPAHPVEHVHPDDRRQQRGFDVLPTSGAFPRPQCVHHAERAEQTGEDVGHRQPDSLRRAARLSRQRHQARLGLHDLVESRSRSVRAASSEPGDGQRDQPRVESAEVVEPETESLKHPWPVVLDEDVGAARQPPQPVGALGGFEVEHHRALVAVGAHVVRGLAVSVAVDVGQPAPAVVASRRFDLHHVRAGVGHHHGRVRACKARLRSTTRTSSSGRLAVTRVLPSVSVRPTSARSPT